MLPLAADFWEAQRMGMVDDTYMVFHTVLGKEGIDSSMWLEVVSADCVLYYASYGK